MSAGSPPSALCPWPRRCGSGAAPLFPASSTSIPTASTPRALGGAGGFPGGAGSFWSWREAMYDLVASLDRDSARRAYVRAFAEMRDAGITTVGEFHYLHHAGEELDYAFDAVVLDAARPFGIRLVLLNAFYASGGIGRPL